MPEVRFTIPGEPVGKGRPRFRTIKCKDGRVFNKPYTPAKTRQYEERVKLHFMEQVGKRLMLECKLEIEILAVFSIAKSDSKAKRHAKLTQQLPVTKKPDGSNILKIVEDGLNLIAYKDDAQITKAAVEKEWGEAPRVVVTLRWED